jgi:predicted RNase H-like nuclease (RuvC/YqgF family)
MNKEEFVKKLGELEGGDKLITPLENILKEADLSGKVEGLETKIKELEGATGEKDTLIESLKKDVESAGGKVSAITEDSDKRIKALEDRLNEADEKATKLEADSARDNMVNHFIDELTPSLGAGLARKEVNSLMFSGAITKNDAGEYAYGEKVGKDAIEAIITENKDFVSGKGGADTTPKQGGDNTGDKGGFAAVVADMN